VTRVRLASAVVAASLAALALSGCGSSSPGISESASTQLEFRVQAVRDAALARDRALAEEKLGDLVQSVNDLRRGNKISAGRAERVLDAANTVRAQLLTIPTTTTTTTTLPPTTREQNEDRRKKDNGNRDGRGGGD
jgi:hypothetical protein